MVIRGVWWVRDITTFTPTIAQANYKYTNKRRIQNIPDVALGVLDRPHNTIDNELLQVRGDAEQCVKAVAIGLVDEREERDSVVGEVQHVGGDHLEGLLEQGVEDAGNVGGDVVLEHGDGCAEQHQHLC